jgi:hypothetical protein
VDWFTIQRRRFIYRNGNGYQTELKTEEIEETAIRGKKKLEQNYKSELQKICFLTERKYRLKNYALVRNGYRL